MRLLLDEHLDSGAAAELRRRGHDVVAVTEEPSLRGVSDAQHLEWAARARRVIVTYDVADFAPLSEERQLQGEPFAGLIFVSSKRYPQGPRGRGALVRDLARALEAHPDPDALRGMSRWLGGAAP